MPAHIGQPAKFFCHAGTFLMEEEWATDAGNRNFSEMKEMSSYEFISNSSSQCASATYKSDTCARTCHIYKNSYDQIVCADKALIIIDLHFHSPERLFVISYRHCLKQMVYDMGLMALSIF